MLTQSRGYPSRRKANRLFNKSFILRLANAGRNNGCAIILCKLAVAFVQLRFIARVGSYAGLEIYCKEDVNVKLNKNRSKI